MEVDTILEVIDYIAANGAQTCELIVDTDYRYNDPLITITFGNRTEALGYFLARQSHVLAGRCGHVSWGTLEDVRNHYGWLLSPKPNNSPNRQRLEALNLGPETQGRPCDCDKCAKGMHLRCAAGGWRAEYLVPENVQKFFNTRLTGVKDQS